MTQTKVALSYHTRSPGQAHLQLARFRRRLIGRRVFHAKIGMRSKKDQEMALYIVRSTVVHVRQ